MLLPRLRLRSQELGDRWTGSASACGARAKAEGRRGYYRLDLFESCRRHAELIAPSLEPSERDCSTRFVGEDGLPRLLDLYNSLPIFALPSERLRLRNKLERFRDDRCRYRVVVNVTSQSGMARVKEASTTLSRPVSTNSPIQKKVAPIRGLPMRDARAIHSRRAKITRRDP